VNVLHILPYNTENMSALLPNAQQPYDLPTCPITHEPFVDPVVDPEGNTYEREAIIQWLEANGVSPITRTPLLRSQLIPNRALQNDNSPPEPRAEVESPQPIPVRTVEADLVMTTRGGLVHISALPIDCHERAAVDVALVIDVSYSMDTMATIKSESGEDETSGLTMLDIVKHAVSTVISVLGPNDRLALVEFHSVATVVLPLTRMDAAGKARANTVNKLLKTQGSTNIWDGIDKGLAALLEGEDASEGGNTRLASCLLLTDGVPNVSPPRGEGAMLSRHFDTHSRHATFSTFGFGYNTECKLLAELAEIGSGSYCFIPDASFVGTVFVNYTANLLSTMTTGATLSIEAEGGARILGLHGGGEGQEWDKGILPIMKTSWGAEVTLGDIHFGQSRDVVIKVDMPESGSLRAVLKAPCAGEVAVAESARRVNEDAGEGVNLTYHCMRQVLTHELSVTPDISSLSSSLQDRANALKDLCEAIHECGVVPASPALSGLLDDVKGQVLTALSLESYYEKWGNDYLASLRFAHATQVRNNFKDPGVQFYGGVLFEKMQDLADDAFMKLPPPVPDPQRAGVFDDDDDDDDAVNGVSRPQSMASYNSRSGPCFDGGCVVTMADGVLKAVRNVRAGDAVNGGARVACVLKTVMPGSQAELVELPGGLLVTPWHPVRSSQQGGKWAFPYRLAGGKAELRACDAVYSFLLEGGSPSMQINGRDVVTLGHGIQGDTVASHAFFGNFDSVCRALSPLRGWDQGLVVLGPGPSVVRNGRGAATGFAATPLPALGAPVEAVTVAPSSVEVRC
jgi:Mg-chelatase subunit ChlD